MVPLSVSITENAEMLPIFVVSANSCLGISAFRSYRTSMTTEVLGLTEYIISAEL